MDAVEGTKVDAGADEQVPRLVAASRRLARLLVDAEVLEDDELLAIQEQHPDEYLGDVLVREGVLLDDYLQGVLIRHLSLPWVPAECCSPAQAVLQLLPQAFCRERGVMPLSRTREFLTVACVNPLDEETADEVRSITGMKVRMVLSSSAQLTALIDRVYEPPEQEDPEDEDGAERDEAPPTSDPEDSEVVAEDPSEATGSADDGTSC